jgi:drug/metabolite transporter (DMT)-like permease
MPTLGIHLQPLEQGPEEAESDVRLPPLGLTDADDTADDETADDETTGTASPQPWWVMVETRRRRNKDDVPTHRPKWVALLGGQAISLVATSMNAASYTLSNHNHVDTQLVQLFLMYTLLATHLLYRDSTVATEGLFRLPGTRIRLQLPWWLYLGMSILDLIPNFLTLLSFRYTSLTSTTLLGSLAVPATMVFSSRLLRRAFGRAHYVGVVLCVLGGGLTVWADFDHASHDDSSEAHDAKVHSYRGDVLAIIAAVIYGLGDTLSEYCVKHVDRCELLGMLGLYGAIFTAFSFPWIEGTKLWEIVAERSGAEQLAIAGVLTWYVASVLLYYMTEALFLVASDATLLNLSLQTANLWAILFSFLVYHVLPPVLFYPALLLVLMGVCIYEGTASSSTSEATTTGTDLDESDERESIPPVTRRQDYASIQSVDHPIV